MRFPSSLALVLLLAPCLARAAEPADEALLTLRPTHEAVVERGRAATLSLALQLAPGHRLLEHAPLVVELEGVALSPRRRVLHRRDAVDPRADAPRFEIEVRADKAGAPTLSAKITAWVCRERRCRPIELSTPIALTLRP